MEQFLTYFSASVACSLIPILNNTGTTPIFFFEKPGGNRSYITHGRDSVTRIALLKERIIHLEKDAFTAKYF